MKAQVHDVITTLADVPSDFAERIIPRGAVGTIVESYREPEGYAVDLAIPDERLVGGMTYVNVILCPEQFDVLEPASTVQQKRKQPHRRRPTGSRTSR